MQSANRILIVMLFMQAFFCSAAEVNIGVAAKDGNELCAAFTSYSPKSGDVVSLVSSEPTGTVIEAKVSGSAGNCLPLEKSSVNGPYFKIEAAQGLEIPLVAFAIIGAGKLAKENGVLSWRGEQGVKPIYLRTCTSSEGLHLTAWELPKVIGRAIWHQYYYLGYDIEPNCSELEVE